VIALKDGRVAFDGKPAEIDERRFKEIYGEDAVEVEIGVGATAEERAAAEAAIATEAAMRAHLETLDTH
jgi:ABC-type phosphate/phosphonate transport system ATPase subunit